MHKLKLISTLVASYLCFVQGPCRLNKTGMNMRQFIMDRLLYHSERDHDIDNQIEGDSDKIVFPSNSIEGASSDEQSCRPVRGGSGRCISLYDCSPLMEIVKKKNQSPQDLETLRKSQCGFQGQIPKVCCPEAAPPPQPSSNACFTPDAQEGECMSLYSCPHLANALTPPVSQETITFVQNSRCNGPDQYSICCGPPRDFSGQNSNPNLAPNKVCSLTAAPPGPRSGCCGIESFIGDRITGGNSTAVDQYPWMAIIEYIQGDRIKLLCGGALISGKYILTAGHCVKGAVLDLGTPRNIRLGEYDTSNDVKMPDCVKVLGGGEDCTTGVTVIPIEKTIPHPDYNPNHHLRRHDIALIRMRQIAPYTEFIRPICLPQTDILASPPSNLMFFVAGWGAINETHSSSTIKQHVDVPSVPKSQCQPAYSVPKRNVALWSGQICAGGEKGKDSCKGDSGGPLMYENGRTFEIIGIVSFGPTPCGIEDIPGVYTKVYEYITWIRSEIKP